MIIVLFQFGATFKLRCIRIDVVVHIEINAREKENGYKVHETFISIGRMIRNSTTINKCKLLGAW